MGSRWLARVPVHGSYLTDVMPSILLTSLGMGAVFVPLTLVATTGLDDSDQGLASGLFNTSQQIGGALGLAILSTIAASRPRGRESRARPRLPLGVRAVASCFVLGALVVLVVLLRRSDVERIQAAVVTADVVPMSG